jgi:hypothetical protein
MPRPVPVELHAPGLDAPIKPSRRQVAEVAAELEHTSRRIAAMPQQTIAKLAPLLDRAQKETAQDLARWLATVPDGDLRYTGHRMAGTLLHLDAALKAIRQLGIEFGDDLAETNRAMGGMALEAMQREYARLVDIFGGPRFGPGGPDLDTARIIAEGQRYLIPRFRTSAARYAGNVKADIQRELAVSVLRGETVTQLTDRLMRLGGPRGTVALRGVAGEPGAVTEHIAEGPVSSLSLLGGTGRPH